MGRMYTKTRCAVRLGWREGGFIPRIRSVSDADYSYTDFAVSDMSVFRVFNVYKRLF